MKSRNSIPEPVRDKLIEPWIRPALPGWWANLSTQSPMDIACRFEHVPPRRLHFSGPRHIHPPDQESAKGKRPAYSCWSALRRKESVRGNPVNGPPRFQLQGQEMTIYISSSKKTKPPNFWRPALPPISTITCICGIRGGDSVGEKNSTHGFDPSVRIRSLTVLNAGYLIIQPLRKFPHLPIMYGKQLLFVTDLPYR